jgi:hypothetical protein
LVAIAVGLVLCALPATAQAQGQLTDTFYFAHDDTLETQSSLFNGVISAPADDQPDDQRLAFPEFLDEADNDTAGGGNNNYTVPDVTTLREVFEFDVAPDEENGSFRVQLNWANPTIDLDMYVYRKRPNGTLDPSPVAQSATGNDEEIATYISPTIDSPVEAGTYVIYVDNWCSSEDDPTVDETLEFFGAPTTVSLCGVNDPGLDEDDFSGKVEFSPLVKMNRLPSANLSGPGEATAGQRVTFSGSGTDSDGKIVEYNFDLDGDGLFEYTAAAGSDGKASVEKLFDQAGDYNIGLRVIDDRGGVAYDSQLLRVRGTSTTTPTPGETKAVAADDTLYSYKLSGPVFGGRKGVALVARYRLRKPARVEMTLYRGTGKKIRRVRRVSSGARLSGRPYRVKISPRRRARGLYTVRLVVRPTDGSPRRIYKLVARRL